MNNGFLIIAVLV